MILNKQKQKNRHLQAGFKLEYNLRYFLMLDDGRMEFI